MTNETALLKDADQLQVHRKSDHPTMQTDGVWDEVVSARKSRGEQIRKGKRIKRFLDALILDLWVAHTYEDNPWRGVARDKAAYQKETRYRKLFFKYDLFVPLLDDLIGLGYVDQKLGCEAMKRRTRIKATSNLIDRCTAWDIEHVHRASDVPEEESIILKDQDKLVIDYADTALTHMWRKKLALINAKLEATAITVPGVKCDTSAKRLYRVFNDGNWRKGGRFVGGFWQQLKQRNDKQREKILIDGQSCCELDFKATHATMVYNMQGMAAPEDSYKIPGFDRDTVKKAFLVLFNCKDREHTLNTMRSKKHIKEAEAVLTAIEDAHPDIRDYFHSRELGLQLQQLDSLIAAGVMDDMYKSNIVCLPIHDSFIVPAQHEEALRNSMCKWWEYHFKQNPSIDKKY